MKQSKIIEAFNASALLSECEISEKEQWELYKLRKILRSHYEFQQQREDAVREKYSSFTNDKGMISGEKAQEFLKDINAIGDLDVEIKEFEKPQITMVKGITCKIIEPLEEFVDFLPPAE